MRLHSLLRIVKEVKIIIKCKHLDENNLCKIYEKRPKRCREFLCKEARVDKKEVRKLTKAEYRKIIWGLLKDYRDDEITSLEELLAKIMAIPFPKGKKNPYEGMATRG